MCPVACANRTSRMAKAPLRARLGERGGDLGAPALGGRDRERAAPLLGELASDREPQARATRAEPPCPGRSVRSRDRAPRAGSPGRGRGRRPTRGRRSSPDGELDRPGRIRHRVVQQVVQDLVHVGGVGVRGAARRRLRTATSRRACRARRSSGPTASATASREVHTRGRALLDVSRHHEEAVHDLRQPVDLRSAASSCVSAGPGPCVCPPRTRAGASCRSAACAAGARRSRRTRAAPARCAPAARPSRRTSRPSSCTSSEPPISPTRAERSPSPRSCAASASCCSGRASDPARPKAITMPASRPASADEREADPRASDACRATSLRASGEPDRADDPLVDDRARRRTGCRVRRSSL